MDRGQKEGKSIKSVTVIKKKAYPEIQEIENSFRVSSDGEICLAIGGDGTFLRAAKRCNRPILHIRGGEKTSLGFHAETTLSNIKEVIDDLKQGNYFIEKYSNLRVEHRNQTYNAVNDVVLCRANSRAIHFKISYYHEDQLLPFYPGILRGDGVLFTRQIGSSAYNYFARGPVLFDINAVVVTPITSNYDFSIVSNKEFYIRLEKGVGILECDGINFVKLFRGRSFTVTQSDKIVQIIRLTKGEPFHEKIDRLQKF
jgi:NAD+ kinase